jgi:autotransporter-associated beta strand protein
MSLRKLACTSLAGGALLLGTSFAQTDGIWTGGPEGTGNSMFGTTNWLDDIRPSAGGDAIIATTATGTAVRSPISVGFNNLTLGKLVIGGETAEGTSLPATLDIDANVSTNVARTLTLTNGITMTEFATNTVRFRGTNAGVLSLVLTNSNVQPFHIAAAGGLLAFNSPQVISGEGGIEKTGLGQISTGGSNTFSGGAILSGGTWVTLLSSSNNTGTIVGPFGSGTLVLRGGTLRSFSATSRTYHNAVEIAGDVILGSDVQTGAQTFSSLAGNITILSTNATLELRSAVTWAQSINGEGLRLTKTGPGTLTLSGATNTWNGFTARQGTISVGASDNIGALPAETIPDFISLDGGTVLFRTTFNTALNSRRGFTVYPAGGVIEVPDGNTMIANGRFLSADPENPSVVTKTGGGTFVMNDNSGTLRGVVVQGGALGLSTALRISPTPVTLVPDNVILDGGAISCLASTATNAEATMIWSSTRGFQLGGAGGTVSVQADVRPVEILGPMADRSPGVPGSLTKGGTGTVTLSGTNTFTGNTLVQSGALYVNGTSVSPLTEAPAGATFGGSGTISGHVNVQGRLAPGADAAAAFGIGGTLTLGSGAVAEMQIGAAAYDRVTGSVATALDGTVNVSFLPGFAPAGGETYQLFSGTISGSPVLNVPVLTDPGLSWETNNFAATGAISIAGGSPAPFSVWTGFYGLTGPSAEGTADPDGDGFVNNLEFAFDGNPTVGTPAILKAVRSGTNQVTFSYVARKSDVSYQVQGSTNLASGPWTNAPITPTNAADQTSILLPDQYERKSFDVSPSGKAFYRVTATITNQ